ncbi:MAG TPA: hypothetical protein VGV18_10520 [Verrucomicrobiae bacterium]|nr:hypothetical protein [Verrucomicrobiae bacterium]
MKAQALAISATVTVNVGDPGITADCGTALVPENTGGNQASTITLSGQYCGSLTGNIQFYVLQPPSQFGPKSGTAATPVSNPNDLTQATVGYTPQENYVGGDSFNISNSYGGFVSGPATVNVFVGSPILTVTPKPYHIALDWSLPSRLQSAIGGDPNGSTVSGYQIYRGVNGSQPGLYETVTVPGNTFSYSYADTIASNPPSNPEPLPNPDTRTDQNGYAAGIAALAFHYDPGAGKNELCALTGYGLGENSDGSANHPNVFELDPNTGNVIAGPVSIPTPEDPAEPGDYSSSDGFVILPNGDFLVNEYDGGDGCTIYREYYGFNPPQGATAGTVVSGELVVNLANVGPGFSYAAGATTDGTYLYFMTNVGKSSSLATFVQTALTGAYQRSQVIDNKQMENIGIVVLQ